MFRVHRWLFGSTNCFLATLRAVSTVRVRSVSEREDVIAHTHVCSPLILHVSARFNNKQTDTARLRHATRDDLRPVTKTADESCYCDNTRVIDGCMMCV
ncbi:hypothetical protein K437DRAFT_79034 [Tilletiaria anomala UBC 951]|uniref:Secreted protein n=1 Tax=Tilletiaria anomala (strain ATCC 24038 / CBS 436.72 / UBC 951) TaxID=1037660 RepID=A0A066WEL8_TILAU|nr:uncharacterized protein K437DRAFT_79034 [Tilletiaria anomala UBC 951]KDN49205.1 hypothetical protein K437DRAFT_79034 [Tilletiaria anomala UBC 951]